VLDGRVSTDHHKYLTRVDNLKIKHHILLSYRHHMNPIERLWIVMNKETRNHQYFSSAQKFREAIERFLKPIDQTLLIH
jgi:transposase